LSKCEAQVTWMKSFGSTDTDDGVKVVSDNSGNVYLAAAFKNPMTMDTVNLPYKGNVDAVIAKLDSNGTILWTQTFGGLYDDRPSSLALTPDGFLIVGGNFFDSCQFGNLMIHGKGYDDAFVAKLDTSNGNVLWVKSAGSQFGYENGKCVTVDSSGNIWFGGSFMNPMIADNDTLYPNGSVDFFILKYSSSGNLLLAKSFGGIGVDDINSISADANDNIYFCGAFSDTMTLGSTQINSAGMLDVFWSCMNSAGNILWAKSAGGLNSENTFSIRSYKDGSYYIGGWVQDTCWFEGNLLLGNEGDIFIARYTEQNHLSWLKQGYNLNANEQGRDLALDKYNNVYLTGQSNFVIQRLEDTGGRMESSEKACPFGDLVFLKYDTAGVMNWMEHTLGSNYNIGNGIAVDNLGNCFVTGTYSDSIWISSFLRTGIAASDILLLRYRDGTFNDYNASLSLPEGDMNASVFPNPAEGNFYVNIFSATGRRPCSVRLFSMQGVKTSEWKIYLDQGMNILQFNSSAPPGMYLLIMEAGTQSARVKVIFE